MIIKIFGIFSIALFILILVWQWDWFVPLINRKASAALGRDVSISHLHVSLGLRTAITVDDLKVAQPKEFESEKTDFASARSITVSVDVWRYLTGKGLSLTDIRLDTPKADIVSRLNGQNNYSFGSDHASSQKSSSSSTSSLPDIGNIEIQNADIRLALAKLKTDMHVFIHTTPPQKSNDGSLVVDAKGLYARQPITGHIVGGALLSLTHPDKPYPIDGRLSNGPTYITLKGTVDDPLHFKGTKLALHMAGPDMALLYALTGIPIPHTPSYSITGNLGYSSNAILFQNFVGRLGSSDLNGNISVKPDLKPPFVNANLHSHLVNLDDLAGFIGAKPSKNTKAVPPSKNILPDQKINVPKLNSINAHLTYHGDHIQNKSLPLDNIDTAFEIKDGSINLDHLNFAVGAGKITSQATFQPTTHQEFNTHFRLNVSQFPLSRIMPSTAMFKGHGVIGGHVTLTSRGNSVASLVANGDGGITLVLDQGGNVTALLPDLLGLKLGSAVLSALNIPNRSELSCLVADMPLQRGILNTHSLLIQTDTTRTTGKGSVNFRNDTIDYSVTTRSVHPQILSLPGAINITGPIANPTVLPGAEIIGRTAAAIGLGILFPPAALIPTIQLGVGKGSSCERAITEANVHPAAGIPAGNNTTHMSGTPGADNNHATHLSPSQIRHLWSKKLHHH
ncbi:AsmA family protein [Swingsia samuiensis]|uniref:AsmA family protein n=1 Tax=Swingsia samuiensis TaxID=1293412 RepID=A0A4Y6UNG3_9PROT|nr:AsmA family protein [Swingsia samuiensis]